MGKYCIIPWKYYLSTLVSQFYYYSKRQHTVQSYNFSCTQEMQKDKL